MADEANYVNVCDTLAMALVGAGRQFTTACERIAPRTMAPGTVESNRVHDHLVLLLGQLMESACREFAGKPVIQDTAKAYAEAVLARSQSTSVHEVVTRTLEDFKTSPEQATYNMMISRIEGRIAELQSMIELGQMDVSTMDLSKALRERLKDPNYLLSLQPMGRA